MSYILDALKKSGEERKQGEIPTLQTVHTDLPPGQRSRSVMHKKLFLALGIGIPIVLALALWQWPAKQTLQITARPGPKEQMGTAERRQTEIQAQRQVPVRKVAPQVIAPVRKQFRPEPQSSPDTAVIQPEVVIEPAPLQQLEGTPPPALPRAASEPESTLPLLRELSLEQQTAIPKITLAGHVFADEPSRRMIMINNRIVREGEMAGDDLRLVRITWDGIILRHIDTEFQIKLQ